MKKEESLLSAILRLWMLISFALFSGASVAGVMAWSNVAPSTTAATAAANGLASVSVSYSVKMGGAGVGDAVQSVALYEGNKLLSEEEFTLRMKSSEIPYNDLRSGTVTALLGVGSHDLYLVATLGVSGLTGNSAVLHVVVSAAPIDTGGADVSLPFLTNPVAGSLPGSLDVTPNGSASYRIPIAIPPGTGGVQPNLSFNYDSKGGNGLLGVGWSLAGLPSIQRCGKTLAQDGMPGRIRFDQADRLCLDSERLIRVNAGASANDDAAYWALGAEFRTEVDSFSRITRLTNGGFKVERKDGRVQYFGTDAGSYMLAQGRTDKQALAWSLAREEDRSGNYYTVEYNQNATFGEYSPKQIRYGGSSVSGQSQDLAVRFVYEDRTDAPVQFVGGSRNDVRSRVSHVQTYTGVGAGGFDGTLVHDYSLGYVNSASSGRSLLGSVLSCANNPLSGVQECLPKTNFEWGQQALSWREDGSRSVPSMYTGLGADAQESYPTDFDGDGKTDWLFPGYRKVCPIDPSCQPLATDDGQGNENYPNYYLMPQARVVTAQGIDEVVTFSFSGEEFPKGVKNILFGDLNGDGRDDATLVQVSGSNSSVEAYCLNDGTTEFKCKRVAGITSTNGVILVDLNNNHRQRIFLGTSRSCGLGDSGEFSCNPVVAKNSTPSVTAYMNPLEANGAFFSPSAINFSKTGQTDFYSIIQIILANDVGKSAVASCVSLGNAGGADQLDCQTVYQPTPNYAGLKAAAVGDLNGDGLTDFVTGVQHGNVVVCLGSETGAVCKDTSIKVGYKTFIGDFAGDGSQGVLILRDGKDAAGQFPADWCRLQKGGFDLVCQSMPLPAISGYYRPDVEDVDGVGKPRIVYTANYSMSSELQHFSEKIFSLSNAPGQDRIVAVVDGFGARTEIDYAAASDSSVIKRYPVDNGTESRFSYPLLPNVPGVVAKQVRKANGQGGWTHQNYRYEGAAINVLGRGEVGFARVEEVNDQGVTARTSYAQDFPFVGMVKAVRTSSSSGQILSDVVNTLESQATNQPSGAQTVFPYLKQSSVARRDLDGSDLGVVASSYLYEDAWGNNTSSTTSSALGGKVFTEQTAISYSNDASAWLVGLPLLSRTTRTDPDSGTLTRTVGMAYDPATGLIKSKTIEPGTPGLELITTYDRSRNSFGLVNVTSQSWIDPYTGSRVTRALSDVTYDAKGRFAETTKNALGQAVLRGFDPASGQMKTQTDSNGLVTTWTLDGFGRIQKENRPDGTEVRYYIKRCDSGCPQNAATVSVQDSWSGGSRIAPPSVTFSDVANHAIRKQTIGFDGRVVVADSRYDELGRLKETDWPRYDGDPAYLQLHREYDALDRIASTSSRDESGAEQVSTIVYQGPVKTISNSKQQKRVETRDALSRLLQVLDAKLGVTRYGYEPFGNLASTLDPNGNQVTVSYDLLGRKTKLNDPDLGEIHYDVDPAGRTWRQDTPNIRAKGQRPTRMEFDLLDRMTARYEADLESHWVFDTAAMGVGRLAETFTGTPSAKDYRRVIQYDTLGREKEVDLTLDTSYSSKTNYDAWGRLSSLTLQRGASTAKSFTYSYNANGYLSSVARSGQALWTVSGQDAAMRVTSAALGNGLVEGASFSPYTGRVVSAQLKSSGGVAKVQESYQYDSLGNVSMRQQYWDAGGFSETSDYDELNRLWHSQVAGQPLQTYSYDAGGNLTGKTGVPGAYAYPTQGLGSVRPHAVSSIPGIGSFGYDLDGNMTSGAGRSYAWSSFDMPTQITKGGVSSSFAYGPEHQRTRQVRSDGLTVTYAGAQEIENRNGQVTVKTYWPYGLGVEIDRPGQATELSWDHKDRLGSPIGLTDASGNFREKLAYDSWGKRRTLDGSATPDSLDGVIDNRGFTGHEMLDAYDLVHMNGRVYDPLIGRFLSPDPLVGDAENGQNYNRYSYVLNNPTNFTDPSGFEKIEVHEKRELVDIDRLRDQWRQYSEVLRKRSENHYWIGAKKIFKPAMAMVVKGGYVFIPGAEDVNNALKSFKSGNYAYGVAWILAASGEVSLAVVTDGLSIAAIGEARAALAAEKAAAKAAESLAIRGGAANIAAHEAYKDGLRAAMSKPAVSDPELARLIDPLYRPNATVGSGSTAAAIRQELATGQPVGGAFHSQKAADSIRTLERWLSNNSAARPGDRAAAENVIRDMRNALGGR